MQSHAVQGLIHRRITHAHALALRRHNVWARRSEVIHPFSINAPKFHILHPELVKYLVASCGNFCYLAEIEETMELKTPAVEPMPRPSLQQMLATIPPQSQRILNHKVSDAHLAEIARALIDWRSVCAILEISEADEAAIKEENPTTDARRYV